MASTEAAAASSNVAAASTDDAQAHDGLRVIDFSGALLDQAYVVQVWALANALFVWMGSGGAKPSLSSLSTAIATRYSPMPLLTSIIGAPEMEEQQIAQRLARRSGRQCFVSCQLPDHVPELFSYVEKQLHQRLVQEGLLIPSQSSQKS